MSPFVLSPQDGAALLLAVAVKGSLLLLLAFGAVAVMRRSSAASRHALWTAVLAVVLLLPALVLAVPCWRVAVLPPASVAVTPAPPAQAPLALTVPSGDFVPAPPPVATELEASLVAAEAPGSDTGVSAIDGWLGAFSPASAGAYVAMGVEMGISAVPEPLRNAWVWLLLGWLFGAVFVAGRWGFAFLSASRLVAEAESIKEPEWQRLNRRVARDLGLQRPPLLLRSDRLAVPIAWGFGRPTVVLPGDADAWDEQRREVVLLHEGAHLARGDAQSQVIAQAAVTMHWFNPLAWLAYRSFLLEREQACDDQVLCQGTRASVYAEHLLQIAQRFRQESLALLAVAPMARRANLENRIRAILNPTCNRSAESRTAMRLAAVAALAVAIPLAAFQPMPADPPSAPMPPAAPAPPELLPAQPPAAPERPAAPAPPVALSATDLAWEGRVASGALVEVYGQNGSVTVRQGGDRVRAAAIPRASDRGADDVRLLATEHRGGVALCVVYSGQSGCEVGSGTRGRAPQRAAQVRVEVELPEGVRLRAVTSNGNVQTEPLAADVEVRSSNGNVEARSRRGSVTAQTTNGNVTVSSTGAINARTTNGNIRGDFQQPSWTGDAQLSTTNGSITVALPSGVNASVDAASRTGGIRSDFPLQISRPSRTGATASGTLGTGGRRLVLRTTNGSIRLQEMGAARSSVQTPSRSEGRIQATSDTLRLAQEAAASAVAAVDWGEVSRSVEEALAEVAAVDWAGIGAEVSQALQEVDWGGIEAEVMQALREARVEIEQERELSEKERQEALRSLRELEREAERLRRRAGSDSR